MVETQQNNHQKNLLFGGFGILEIANTSLHHVKTRQYRVINMADVARENFATLRHQQSASIGRKYGKKWPNGVRPLALLQQSLTFFFRSDVSKIKHQNPFAAIVLISQ